MIGRAGRAGVHLLLGGVVALPVVGVAWLLGWAADGSPSWLLLALVAIAGVLVVALLPVVRPLAITAARGLLDVPLSDPPGPPGWSARRRAASWLGLQAVLGTVTVLAILFLLPTAAGFATLPLTGAAIRFSATGVWPATGLLRALGPAIALGCLAVLVAVVVVLGSLSRRLAPWFLGPTTAERLAAARAQAAREARHARMAGELHDGVGHVLTAVTLQAAAARRVFDTDPDFARRALGAIEERARDAVADLDRVLGLLRADDAPDEPGLECLDEVVEAVRAGGLDVEVDRRGEVADPALSALALAVAREGLTNAARHGLGSVRVVVDTRDDVTVTVTNPGPPGATRPGGGHGLAGLRVRVEALGGTLVAGPESGDWVLRAHLPAARGWGFPGVERQR